MRALVLVIAFFALASYARAADPSIEDGSAQVALDDARGRWAAQGIVNYSYVVRQFCFCFPMPDGRVYVRRDAVYAPDRLKDLASVPRLLSFIQRSINLDSDRLSVAYADSGLPVSIDEAAFLAPDVGSQITISGFRVESAEPPSTGDSASYELPQTQATPTTRQRRQAELDAARARWRTLRLRNYDFRVAVGNLDPRRVRVRAGRPVKPGVVIGRWSSVPRLFRFIEQSITAGDDVFEVTYSARGVPRRVAVGEPPGDVVLVIASGVQAVRRG